MSKIYKGVSELIGKTPIIEAVNFEKAVEADATILAKLEYFNPAGSVKDRTSCGQNRKNARPFAGYPDTGTQTHSDCR